MERGKVYKPILSKSTTCSECGAVKSEKLNNIITFPFDEKYGIFLGITEEGYFHFRLSGLKECVMPYGFYEKVEANITITPIDNF